VTLEADWKAYSIRRNPALEATVPSAPQVWTVALTLNVAPNFGVTLSRRSGRDAPLFEHRRVMEIGATYLR
jgi:hypothetical protein